MSSCFQKVPSWNSLDLVMGLSTEIFEYVAYQELGKTPVLQRKPLGSLPSWNLGGGVGEGGQGRSGHYNVFELG